MVARTKWEEATFWRLLILRVSTRLEHIQVIYENPKVGAEIHILHVYRIFRCVVIDGTVLWF